MSITTPLTELLGIEHPILLAGMGSISGAPLAAAVSDAGGLGVIGGVGYTPAQLQDMINELKSLLKNPKAPFGVDLLIPQAGGSAWKTNKDYTKGALSDLVNVIISSGASLFVSAVGILPPEIVKRLHDAGVVYMNMVGHPKHAIKACKAGADIICAQGGEAGGHTGDIPFSVLVPACADVCKGFTSPITGKKVLLVAAGGVFDGRSVAAALTLRATGVWIGTRFVAAKESGASEASKKSLIRAGFNSAIVTTISTGRPCRIESSPYIANWENNRQQELKDLQSRGILPLEHVLDKLQAEGKLTEEIEDQVVFKPMSIVAGMVTKLNQPAGEIVQEMAKEEYDILNEIQSYNRTASKL